MLFRVQKKFLHKHAARSNALFARCERDAAFMRGNCIPLVLQPVASILRCISFAAWRALLRAKMGRSSELRAPLAVPC